MIDNILILSYLLDNVKAVHLFRQHFYLGKQNNYWTPGKDYIHLPYTRNESVLLRQLPLHFSPIEDFNSTKLLSYTGFQKKVRMFLALYLEQYKSYKKGFYNAGKRESSCLFLTGKVSVQ